MGSSSPPRCFDAFSCPVLPRFEPGPVSPSLPMLGVFRPIRAFGRLNRDHVVITIQWSKVLSRPDRPPPGIRFPTDLGRNTNTRSFWIRKQNPFSDSRERGSSLLHLVLPRQFIGSEFLRARPRHRANSSNSVHFGGPSTPRPSAGHPSKRAS